MSDVANAFQQLSAALDRQIAAVTERQTAGMQAWDKFTVKEAARRVRGLQRIQRSLAKLQIEWEPLRDYGPSRVPPSNTPDQPVV